MDAAILSNCVRLLTEFDERVLTGETLPAFRYNPRRIDAGCAVVDTRRALGRGAIAVGAVDGARHVQIGGQGDGLVRVRHVLRDRGTSARSRGGGASAVRRA